MAQVVETSVAQESNNGVPDEKAKLYNEFQEWLETKNKKPSPKGIFRFIGKLSNTERFQPPPPPAAAEAAGGAVPEAVDPQVAEEDIHREVSDSIPPANVHGFQKELLSLQKFLIEQENTTAIAVVGAPGVGKTTLCQTIFNHEQVKNNFLPRIWISMFEKNQKVGQDAKIAILKRILYALGVDDEFVNTEKNLKKLLYALHLNLWGKRYLIILDDARDPDGWCERLDAQVVYSRQWGEALAFGFPKGYGGKVIFTSQNEDLAKKIVGDENLNTLLPLCDTESCWSIYIDAIKEKLPDFELESLDDQKLELQNKCGGLPLAAKMMGEIYSTQTIDPPIANGESNHSATPEILPEIQINGSSSL